MTAEFLDTNVLVYAIDRSASLKHKPAASRISFRDAMIVRSESELGASVLWSEDPHAGGEIAGVRVLDSFVGALALEGFPR